MMRISWVAYAVDESASDAKIERPVALPIVSLGASAVGRGLPMSHVRHERPGSYCPTLPATRGRLAPVWVDMRSSRGDGVTGMHGGWMVEPYPNRVKHPKNARTGAFTARARP